MSRTLWLTFAMGSSEWRVYLTDPEDPVLLVAEDEQPAEAMTFVGESTIYVNRTLRRDRVPEVLVHELLHAAAFISGLSVTQRWKPAREEVVVHSLAPMVAHALKSAGLWRGRRVPR